MKVLSNPCTVVVSEDLHLFAGLFGTEDFLNDGRKSNSRWYPFLTMNTSETISSAHISNSCEQHHSPMKRFLDTLTETTIHRFDREEVQRNVCEL